MNEPSFLIGPLAPGSPFVLVAIALLAVAVAVRAAIRRRGEERFVAATRGIERWILTGILLVLIGLSVFQIVFRNFFGSGFVWIDPLLRTLVLWLTFLGAFAATARGRHIAIDVFGRILPAGARSWLQRGLSLVAGAVCVALADGAYEFLSFEREFRAEAFLGLETWQSQSILLAGFLLLAYRFFLAAVLGPPADDREGEGYDFTPGPEGRRTEP